MGASCPCPCPAGVLPGDSFQRIACRVYHATWECTGCIVTHISNIKDKIKYTQPGMRPHPIGGILFLGRGKRRPKSTIHTNSRDIFQKPLEATRRCQVCKLIRFMNTNDPQVGSPPRQINTVHGITSSTTRWSILTFRTTRRDNNQSYAKM